MIINYYEEELRRLARQHLLRNPKNIQKFHSFNRIVINDKSYVNFSSNDYLGLTKNPVIIQTAEKNSYEYGIGVASSRLITGDTVVHRNLEEKIAKWHRKDAALVFSSGYSTNLGVISTLVGKSDAIVADRFVHASIIDGAKSSKAKLFIYPHNDIFKLSSILEKNRCKFNKVLVVTESVFSMDGDIAPLQDIIDVANFYDCLALVDEAHAIGVFGKTGSGLMETFGTISQNFLIVGTLSKAIASNGGYLAGPQSIINYLFNKCRSFIYTTAISPVNCAIALKAIEIIQNESCLRKKLWSNIDYFHKIKKIDKQKTPIIPIIIGSALDTNKIMSRLFDDGFFVYGVRPPTVPKETSRLRISLTSNHRKKDIKKLADRLP